MIPLPTDLRHYQLRAWEESRELFAAGVLRLCLVAPTGAGKTRIMRAQIVAGPEYFGAPAGSPIVVVAPRTELVDQVSAELDSVGVDHGVIQADHWRKRPHLPVQVASTQTLLKRSIVEPGVIFIDEGHLYWDAIQRLIERFPRARFVLLTATPIRLDGRGLGAHVERLVIVSTVAQLIQEGHLVPFRLFRSAQAETNLQPLAEVPTVRGDYARGALATAMNRITITGDVVDTWRRHAADRSTLVFGVDVQHSKDLAQAFREAGVTAEHVDADTPKDIRKRTIARLRSGELQVVTNVELFTYGTDVPRVDCISCVRPTQALQLWLQMCGRGMRTFPGKENLVILDHTENWRLHGRPDREHAWSLAGLTKREREAAPGTRECLTTEDGPGCYAISPAGSVVCVCCGKAFPKRGKLIITIAGELREDASEDVGAATGPARTIVHSSPERRAKNLADWIQDGRAKGFSPGAAFGKYKAVYGAMPSDEVVKAASEAVRNRATASTEEGVHATA